MLSLLTSSAISYSNLRCHYERKRPKELLNSCAAENLYNDHVCAPLGADQSLEDLYSHFVQYSHWHDIETGSRSALIAIVRKPMQVNSISTVADCYLEIDNPRRPNLVFATKLATIILLQRVRVKIRNLHRSWQ